MYQMIAINKKKIIENYIIFIFILLVFKITPISYLGVKWANTLIELVVILCLVSMWVINYNSKLILNKTAYMIISLFLILSFSSIRVFVGLEADVKGVFNVLLYALVYITILSFTKNYNLDKYRIIKYMYIVIGLNIALTIVAYINSNVFNVFNILFETSKSAPLGSSYKRFSGTFSNPNFFGIFYAVIGVSFLFSFLTKRRYWIVSILGFILSFYLINISGSRSGLLTFLILIFIMLSMVISMYSKKRKVRSKTIFRLINLLLLVMIVLSLIQLLNYQESQNSKYSIDEIINSRLLDGENAENNLIERFVMVRSAINTFWKNPFLGAGPSPNSIDNQFARILMESGIIAFINLLLLVAYLIFTRIANFSRKWNHAELELSFVTSIFIIALFINMFGAAMFSVTQIMSLYFFLQALNDA